MSTRRTGLVATVVLAAAATLAACGASNTATATLDYAPSDGVLGTIGSLRVQNVVVVAPPEGSTTAVVSMTVAERGSEADRLEAATVADAGKAQVTGAREIPAGGSVRFGAEDAAAQITVPGFTAPPGATVMLTLRFERAGELVLKTPVVEPEGYYEGLVAPGALPTPTGGVPTATPATPTPGAAASPAAPRRTPTPGPGGRATPAIGVGGQQHGRG